MNVLCVVMGHKYGSIEKSPDHPERWSCRRCGHQRFTPPTDVPAGSDGGMGQSTGGM
jgi:hypothetical protein